MLNLSLSDELSRILVAIQLQGGEPLFVGGFVRDALMGHEHKDFDIEVYGLTAEHLLEVLNPFGWVEQVGMSFGVIKLRTDIQEYDFSLPRRESKEGQGHKGFMVQPDASMTVKEAASRRDFTVNAMALTVDGKLLDYFDGLQDWQNKHLRHVSEKFAEDPLRVLRGFQFAARFDFDLDAETAELAKSLKKEYSSLPKERIWHEWQKWAEKSTKPSKGLRVLKQTEWLEFYPELASMVDVPQDVQWHPEGDVFTHTGFVCDVAAEVATRENLSADTRVVLLFAALCHDLGKAVTTLRKNGRWASPRHAPEGVPLTRKFLERIHAPHDLIKNVTPLVKEHMSHLNELNPRAIRRLALRLEPTNIDILALLIEADASGRPPLPGGLPENARRMLELARALDLEQDVPRPILLGRHLIELANTGDLPAQYKKGGVHFAALLNKVFQAQLDGLVSDLDEAKQYALRVLNDV